MPRRAGGGVVAAGLLAVTVVVGPGVQPALSSAAAPTEPAEPDPPPPTEPAGTDAPPPTEPVGTDAPPSTEPVDTGAPPSTEPVASTEPSASTEPATSSEPVESAPAQSSEPVAISTEPVEMAMLPVERFGPLPPLNTRWLGSGGSRSSGRAPGATSPIPGRTPPVLGEHVATPVVAAQPAETTESDVVVEAVVAAIRHLESGGAYDQAPDATGRSGAYGYGPATWRGYAGYGAAHRAPPEVQDTRARFDVRRLLEAVDYDVAAVPAVWFHARAADTGTPPGTAAGSVPPRWIERWESVYAESRAEASAAAEAATVGREAASAPEAAVAVSVGPVDDERAAPPVLPAHGSGAMRSIAFPVLGPARYHPGWNDCRADCTRRHEGVDIVGVRMQPLLAAEDGTVTFIGTYSDNSGRAITITAADGWRYNYFHLNNDSPGTDDGGADALWTYPAGLRVGDRVQAGQIIGYMGDSGNSEHSVPHLHFEIRDPSGAPRDPYWSLQAAERRQACMIGLGPWSAVRTPPDGVADGTAHTIVTPLWGDGAWIVDSQGRVTATGDAALITPSTGLGCLPGPAIPHGIG